MTRLTPEQINFRRTARFIEYVAELEINDLQKQTLLDVYQLIKHGSKFINLHIRKDGREYHFEADWLKQLFHSLSHTESDGWQTMETAPRKPYYRVLLGSPEIPESASDDGYPAISTTGFYLDAEPDGPDSMGHDAGWVDEDYGTYDPGRSFGNPQYFRNPSQPTHWRPLPAPPETTNKG